MMDGPPAPPGSGGGEAVLILGLIPGLSLARTSGPATGMRHDAGSIAGQLRSLTLFWMRTHTAQKYFFSAENLAEPRAESAKFGAIRSPGAALKPRIITTLFCVAANIRARSASSGCVHANGR
jgi:hypothetical protein